MKLAELDLLPEVIAVLGMEAAAQSEPPIQMGTAPDRLAQYSEPVQRDWLLFALFIESPDHVEWCMRKDYSSPDEWVADDEQRRRWQMKPLSDGFKTRWAAYREKHVNISRALIEVQLSKAAAAA